MQNTTWGRWKFVEKTCCLETTIMVDNGPKYEIAIDQITSIDHISDWKRQLEEKTWISEIDISDFENAVTDLLGTDAINGSADSTFDAKAILKEKYGCSYP